jgi:hypothetical protein
LLAFEGFLFLRILEVSFRFFFVAGKAHFPSFFPPLGVLGPVYQEAGETNQPWGD